MWIKLVHVSKYIFLCLIQIPGYYSGYNSCLFDSRARHDASTLTLGVCAPLDFNLEVKTLFESRLTIAQKWNHLARAACQNFSNFCRKFGRFWFLLFRWVYNIIYTIAPTQIKQIDSQSKYYRTRNRFQKLVLFGLKPIMIRYLIQIWFMKLFNCCRRGQLSKSRDPMTAWTEIFKGCSVLVSVDLEYLHSWIWWHSCWWQCLIESVIMVVGSFSWRLFNKINGLQHWKSVTNIWSLSPTQRSSLSVTHINLSLSNSS